MAYLNEIRLYDDEVEKISPYRGSSSCAIHLFMRLIKRQLATENISVIDIRIVADLEKHLTYHITGGGFALVYYDMGKVNLAASPTNYERKKLAIDTVYKVLCHLSVKQNWDINIIMDAYNKCLELEIRNEWWFKDKLFASPGRRHYVGLYHIYDTGRYEIYIVLFDKNKNELIRHLIYKTDFELFVIEKISWQSKDTVSFKFIGPNKLFVYSVDQLLNSEVEQVPERIHLLFK